MSPRDFDRHFDDARRRIRRTQRAMLTAIVVIWALVLGAGGWALLHPENLGNFAARVVAGFTNADRTHD